MIKIKEGQYTTIKTCLIKALALGDRIATCYKQREANAGKTGIVPVKLDDYISLLRDSQRMEYLSAYMILERRGIKIDSGDDNKKLHIRQAIDKELSFIIKQLAEFDNKIITEQNGSPHIVLTDEE